VFVVVSKMTCPLIKFSELSNGMSQYGSGLDGPIGSSRIGGRRLKVPFGTLKSVCARAAGPSGNEPN
jgi:hypothetical protein